MATLAGFLRPLIAHLEGSRDGHFAFEGLAARTAVLGALLLAGCGPGGGRGASLVVVDDAGDSTFVTHPFTRVVSLAPATTELTFAIGAGDRLVGRTRWCDYPEAALALPDLGDGLQPSLEAVLAVRPDLVLLYRSATNTESAKRLRAAGVAALQLAVDRLDDVPRVARLIGPALGQAGSADSMAAAFERDIARLRAERGGGGESGPTVLLLAWDAPPIAIGAASFQSEILALAGGRNIFGDLDRPSAEVSLEAIVARNPDAVLITGGRAPEAFDRPEWRVIPAIRERRFIQFDHPAFDRPSPRAPGVIIALRTIVEARGW
ncbi:MAG: helical backbone metal receptor [Gemmatimonadota bacterium]|nr:helical backbone metal receptor [Gemmatimonadota bacterium]